MSNNWKRLSTSSGRELSSDKLEGKQDKKTRKNYVRENPVCSFYFLSIFTKKFIIISGENINEVIEYGMHISLDGMLSGSYKIAKL